MALKRCSYKGCSSVHTPDNPSRETTFFQFPKDETRYEIWMAMSRCEDRSKSTKYLCSKHFDHSKYMSSNPRRNLLLANAVPFAYQSENEESEEEEDVDQLQDVVSTQYGDEDFFAIQERVGDETGVSEEAGIVIQFAESTDSQQVEVVDQSDFNKTQQPEQRKISKPEVVEYYKRKVPGTSSIADYYKRKLPETSSEEPKNVKIVKICAVQNQQVKTSARSEVNFPSNSLKSMTTEKEVSAAEEDLVIEPSVTTFIFKGEEYVQMPKKYYVEEKLGLMRELQLYKDIVINFKNLLENVKL